MIEANLHVLTDENVEIDTEIGTQETGENSIDITIVYNDDSYKSIRIIDEIDRTRIIIDSYDDTRKEVIL